MNVKVKVIKCRNSICGRLGFSNVLEQYLKRHMKENKKTTGLCTKNNNSVNKHNTKMDEDI